MNRLVCEKEMKSWLKNKCKINTASVVAFLILGFAGLSTVSYGATNNEALFGGTANSDNTIAIGKDSVAGGKSGVGTGAGSGAIAVGVGAKANVKDSVAIGFGADSGINGAEPGTIAIGKDSKAHHANSIAIGPNAEAGIHNKGATAIGADSKAAQGAAALGSGSNADGAYTIAVGQNSKASGNHSMSLGLSSQTATAGGVTLGGYAVTTGSADYKASWDVTVGYRAKNLGATGTVIGNGAYASDKVFDFDNDPNALTAADFDAKVKAKKIKANDYIRIEHDDREEVKYFKVKDYQGITHATSIGNQAKVVGTSSNAIGSRATVTANSATAIGAGANTDIDNSVAIGNKAKTDAAIDTKNSVIGGVTFQTFRGTTDQGGISAFSVGNEKYTDAAGRDVAEFNRQIQNVAAGRITEGSTDAVNGSQAYALTKGILDNSPLDYGLRKPDGSIESVTKVGDKYYVVDKDGNPVYEKNGDKVLGNDGKEYSIIDGKYYAPDQLETDGSVKVDPKTNKPVPGIPEGAFDGKRKEADLTGGNTIIAKLKGTDPQTIGNVADGKNANEAVNVKQLEELRDSTPFTYAIEENGVYSPKKVVRVGDEFFEVADDGTKTKLSDADKANVVAKVKTDTPMKLANIGSALNPSGDIGTNYNSGNDADVKKAITDAQNLINGNPADANSKGLTQLVDGEAADMAKLNSGATVRDLQALAIGGMSFKGDKDDEILHRALGSTLNIAGGADSNALTSGNIGVVVNNEAGNERIEVKLAQDIKGINSIEFGKTDENGNALAKANDGKYYVATQVGADGAPNAGATAVAEDKITGTGKITGLAEGTANDDAVNVKQLKEMLEAAQLATNTELEDGTIADAIRPIGAEVDRNANNIAENSRRIDALDGKVNRTAALSAAMAGLHTLEYKIDRPNQVMAAVGFYRESQAVAVGLAHHFDEDFMVSGSVSATTESRHPELMANLGFALRLGDDDKDRRGENLAKQDGRQLASVYNLQTEVQKSEMKNKAQAKEINELKSELSSMKAELEAIKKLLKK